MSTELCKRQEDEKQPAPMPRKLAVLGIDLDYLYIFGGQCKKHKTEIDKTWRYNLLTKQWNELNNHNMMDYGHKFTSEQNSCACSPITETPSFLLAESYYVKQSDGMDELINSLKIMSKVSDSSFNVEQIELFDVDDSLGTEIEHFYNEVQLHSKNKHCFYIFYDCNRRRVERSNDEEDKAFSTEPKTIVKEIL
uniref:Uncharacterized protein n=1 Tax=Ditylenchus dipsaci TaxID=166011 RepID=A0A915DUW2_9BILA